MELLVRSYLSRYFEVKTNEEANTKISWLVYDGIYPKSYNGYRNIIKANNLINDLKTIFSIDTLQAMNYINNWSIIEKKGVDLRHYWR